MDFVELGGKYKELLLLSEIKPYLCQPFQESPRMWRNW